jgi:hypothetical protein
VHNFLATPAFEREFCEQCVSKKCEVCLLTENRPEENSHSKPKFVSLPVRQQATLMAKNRNSDIVETLIPKKEFRCLV